MKRHRIGVRPAAHGPLSEVWVYGPDGKVARQYRFTRNVWQQRTGYGDLWRTCARPDLPTDVLARMERRTVEASA